jgi:hypothetical protein
MEPPQRIYGQDVTHFRLQLFVRPDARVAGRLVADLADIFLSELLVPACRVVFLMTKAPGMRAKANHGPFSERRWNTTLRKVLGDAYAVVNLDAQVPDFPHQTIGLFVQINPPGGNERLGSGTIEVSCSVPYLRYLAAEPQKVEALLRLGRTAWDGVPGGVAYGFGNAAMRPPRPLLHESGGKMPWETIEIPDQRPHPIPVAYVGTDVDGNLERRYVTDRGIKGAFWANFLSPASMALCGGEHALRSALGDMRVEPLADGGVLIVATDNPLPEDSEPTRERFLRLTAALRGAFLSRAEMPETMRRYLAYFYREAPV